MTYHNLWRSLLPVYDSGEAQAIVRLVLDEEFHLSLTDMLSGGLDSLSVEQSGKLLTIMNRLQSGEPVQYVLGYAYFCGRKFHVEPGVLIPRPETEELCKIVIEDYKSQTSNLKPQTSNLIDVGTGSGCIAITLALQLAGAQVEAVDISEKALEIARNNAIALGAVVNFRRQDILSSSPADACRVDAIVSNPPYIAEREKATMHHNVTGYEPSTALFVPDDDPLLFYRAIAGYAQGHLNDGGRLYFEINPLFANELKAMLQSQGFTDVGVISDSFGRLRFARAFWQKKS